jgi:hypothetical protein
MIFINMAQIEYKTNQQRVVPVKRNGLFYDREQFKFDMEIAREYIEGDMGQSVVLYQVDLTKTNQDDLYGETKSDSIVYFPPVEIPCVYEVEPPELRAYDKQKNLGTYQKMGKLKFGVMEQTLIDFGVDIKIGDFVGVQVSERMMVYFQVENDGRNNFDNQHLQFGTVPFYRSITASWVDGATFNG